MNYLAHALLSPQDPLILMGNLWGDMIKPRDYVTIDPAMVKGVLMHKAIDAYTDQHPAVIQMVKILRPYQGKYTPVVADVLMDYSLSKKWETYHPESIEDFCQKVYTTVAEYLPLIPDRLHPRITRMLGHRWLESCKSRERMEQTLKMLSRRASFENKIPEAMIAYDLHQATLDLLFVNFFEDLKSFVNLQNED